MDLPTAEFLCSSTGQKLLEDARHGRHGFFDLFPRDDKQGGNEIIYRQSGFPDQPPECFVFSQPLRPVFGELHRCLQITCAPIESAGPVLRIVP